MHYIQYGTMIALPTCPNSRELFHTLRGWVLSVVLSGSLNPPSDAQYIPRALRVLASRATTKWAALSSGLLDTDPEPLRAAVTSERPVTGPTGKEGEATAIGLDTGARPLSTQTPDIGLSSDARPGVTGRSPTDPSMSARPRLSEEPMSMASVEWRTPQEMDDYQLAPSIAKA